MSRRAYTLLLRACAPLIWAWMLRRSRRAGGQWGIFSAERFGRGTPVPWFAPPVWVHAVSLGETRAAEPLVRALLQRQLPVLLTHTTATGRGEGARLFAAAIAAGQLRQAWLPYDFPGAVRRFFMRHAPRVGVLIEREIWPNLLAGAAERGVPVVLASARFSASSLRQARWSGSSLREAIGSLAAVLVQTSEDAERLTRAGARDARVVGNLKFDVRRDRDTISSGKLWREASGRRVVAIASTREGEDALFTTAIAAAPAPGDVLYLLIPRHPQRFGSAMQSVQAAGLAAAKRSDSPLPPGAGIQVVVGDTLGEMPFYYGASDVAIVGGSFAPLGGQNLIEACAAGVPVIVGPHTFHFEQAASDAIGAGAALRVADAAQAVRAAHDLLADDSRRQAMRTAAAAFIDSHAGATARVMGELERWL